MVHISQNELILQHLQREGSITSLEAMTRYGIMRLASRITDLRHEGHDISSVFETRKTDYKTVRYSRYYLGKGE